MTRRDLVAAAAFVVTSAVLTACGGASNTSSDVNAGVCGGQTGTGTASSAKYIVVLVATPLSGTASRPASASPTPSPSAPPVVLSGTLASVAGPGATHIELHICDRATGSVASALRPEVTTRDVTAGTPAVALPVAVLQDAGQGVNGTAYGNNAVLEPEESYAITVRIDAGNSVSLPYQPPQTGATPSPQPGCLDNHQFCAMAGS